jgi:cathepsin L
MRTLILFALLGVVLLQCLASKSLVFADDDSNDDSTGLNIKNAWIEYKKMHHKKYNSFQEDAKRLAVWLRNRALIIEHNLNITIDANHTGRPGFTLIENYLADWLPAEYKKLLGFNSTNPKLSRKSALARTFPFNGYIIPTLPPSLIPYRNTVNVSSLPATVNWTAKGFVNPVENQGQCGDCWAFAACGAMEAQYYNVTGKSATMSEQNLLDCTTSYGNQGCNGGSMNAAYTYVQNIKGVDSYNSYPYTGTEGSCAYKTSSSLGYVKGYQTVEIGNELALQQAVALIGPVSVGIDASLPSFQLYHTGVYQPADCSSTNLDHAVLVVGYGTTSDNTDYWLIKNSWGTSWGIQGYMMMARNDNNMCGIASDASFPTDFVASAYNPGLDDTGSSGSTAALSLLSVIFTALSVLGAWLMH